MKKAHFYNTLSQFSIIFRFPFITSRMSGLKTLGYLLLLVMSFWNGKLVGQTTWYVNDNSITGDVYTSAVGNDSIASGIMKIGKDNSTTLIPTQYTAFF